MVAGVSEIITTAGMVQPGFRIGEYTLRDGHGGAGKVWVERGDGEGADFDAAAIEKLIAEFYKEHF